MKPKLLLNDFTINFYKTVYNHSGFNFTLFSLGWLACFQNSSLRLSERRTNSWNKRANSCKTILMILIKTISRTGLEPVTFRLTHDRHPTL